MLASFLLILLLAIPGLWRLGLDQAAWVAIALGLGAYAHGARLDRRFSIFAAAFLAIIVISGVLGAEGERWLTLGRELVIGFGFFAAVVGAAAIRHDPPRLQAVLIGLAFVLAVSSAASLLAFATQKFYPFETPIADLIPDAVASTRLGELTFTDRALGTWSYFLGTMFVRPQGLFLFSTSQAVALAGAVPIFIAAGLWYRALRWAFWGASGLSFVALLTTTTRTPIAALAVSLVAAAAYSMLRHSLGARIRRHRAWLLAASVALLVGIVIAVGTGAAASVVNALTARSLGPRAELYAATIERWTERPLLGFGTEVDWIETDRAGQAVSPRAAEEAADAPPLGSHSHYLGVLFKQGAVGMFVFAGLLATIIAGARRHLAFGDAGSILIVAAVATTLLSGLTESLWLDPAAALSVALVWGLALAAPPDPIGAGTRRHVLKR